MSATVQQLRINDVLYYIHQDISRDLPAAALAQVAAYSEQHFHRVFKDVVGENVHAYVRRIRLEFAANQLMFEAHSTVLEVANNAGFSSVSSFSRAFKERFLAPPGVWRSTAAGLQNNRKKSPETSDKQSSQKTKFVKKTAWDQQVKLLELPARQVAYVRHTGYDKSIKRPWQTLQAWAISRGRDYSEQFGLLHSNPALTPLAQCRYVACIGIDEPLLARGGVNSLVIPAGLHAVFKLTGRYGDFLIQLDQILSQWLPHSGLKMLSTPAYVNYKKNHFLAEDEFYELDFCLPVSFY